jgi:hypothetical protein
VIEGTVLELLQEDVRVVGVKYRKKVDGVSVEKEVLLTSFLKRQSPLTHWVDICTAHHCG